jgi:excisionase family DNA binding protein
LRDPKHPNIVTTDQLCDLIGISPSTVQRWARERTIPSLRGGKDLRFEVDKVLAALAAPRPERTKRTAPRTPPVAIVDDFDALPAKGRKLPAKSARKRSA